MKKQDNELPYGKIKSIQDIGRLVRDHRKSQSVSQTEFAALCGVGVRFISELENGKPTLELGKVLHVLKCLGLEVTIRPREWQKNTRVNLNSESSLSVHGDIE